MKTKYTIGILLTILIGVGVSLATIQRRAAWAASSAQPIQSDQADAAQALPPGNCCLRRLHKRSTGIRQVQYGLPYQCDTGQTKRGQTTFRLPLSSEMQCEQSQVPIPNGSVLEATGDTIRRFDGFAHFSGNFTIRNPAGAVLFQGTMDAIDRIGTHHAPFGAEVCNQGRHLEGWLTGRGSALLPNHLLRALIVARAILPPNNGQAAVSASIDGTVIKCP